MSEGIPIDQVQVHDMTAPEVQVPQPEATQIPVADFEIPKDSRGRIDWKTLEEDPARLSAFIEAEAIKAKEEGANLSSGSLISIGKSGLTSAIVTYYPGGFRALRTNLGDETIKKRTNGFWNDPKNVEEQARKFLDGGGILLESELRKSGRSSLGLAINSYPGGIVGLRNKLEVGDGKVPTGYWEDTANIEKEARKVLVKKGKISQLTLRGSDARGLNEAVKRKYPGGIQALKVNLELSDDRKVFGYWNDIANIEAEAEKAYNSGIILITTALKKAKLSSLSSAISSNYPGGFSALRAKFELPELSKPQGYWQDPANIEREAKEAMSRGIKITATSLSKVQMNGLRGSIRDYPGGYIGLRKKLGLPESLQRPFKYWDNPTNIENAVREAMEKGQSLRRLLYKADQKYPGGSYALREKFGIAQREVKISPDDADVFFRSLEIE